MLLNRMADITQAYAWANHFDTDFHALVGDARNALSLHSGFADLKHATGITVVPVLDDGDVDIDDIAVFELFFSRNAVADDVIHRSADRFRKTAVVQRCRHGLLLVDHEVVADVVQLLRGYTGFYMGLDHAQHVGGQAAGNAHLVDILARFDRNAHKFRTGWLLKIRDYGIKRAPSATARQN